MKYGFVLLLMTALGFSSLNAQTTETTESCYDQWAKVFDTRGANDVAEGEHAGIIIAIRRVSGGYDCFVGKVSVEKNVVKSLYRQLADDSYEIYEPNPKYKNSKMEIVNGITTALQTVDGEVIYVIFKDHLKPKKQEYKEAPLPNPDDF